MLQGVVSSFSFICMFEKKALKSFIFNHMKIFNINICTDHNHISTSFRLKPLYLKGDLEYKT